MSRADDPSNKRRGVRTEVVLKVEYDDPELVMADHLTNLGSGGLFVRTDEPFEKGRSLGLTLSFPGFLEPLSLRGTVRWRRTAAGSREDEVPGMGIELDLSDPEVREIFEALTSSLERPRASEGGPLQLLLVDDNQVVIELFTHAIRKFSRERGTEGEVVVTTASDGREALEILQATAIHAAIVDQVLPVLDGIELIRQMRADANLRAVPVLSVSASGGDARKEALRAGADLFLQKPVTLSLFTATLRTLIGLRNAPPPHPASRSDG